MWQLLRASLTDAEDATRWWLLYGNRAEEDILMGRGSLEPHRLLQAVASAHEVQALQVAASQVKVAAPVASYVVALCERSRQPGFAQSGLSTRAALTLMRSAMATALPHLPQQSSSPT